MGKCWICGTDGAKTFSYVKEGSFSIQKGRCYCDECYNKRVAELSEKKNSYVQLKKYLMLERAVRILEKQSIDIYEYKDTIEEMVEYVHEHPEKFDSAHEMIAAIILVHEEVASTMQYKIGRYRADFYIPEFKIILEIDGDRHDPFTDNQRDIAMRNILGADWEVVRISTEYLEQNAKRLVDAITAVKAEKQKIRKENYGILPEWYSKRERARRKIKPKLGDDAIFQI